MRGLACASLFVALATGALGCRDLSGFTTNGDSYQGGVVDAPFILAGIDGGATSMCLTIDANHLQDTPGKLSTSDGRFQHVDMRTIPQIWQDPLSTLQFGEGRLKNLMYVVRATTAFGDGEGNDVMAVVSLMQNGDVEVRLVRGAPVAGVGDAAAAGMQNVFALFILSRHSGPCSY